MQSGPKYSNTRTSEEEMKITVVLYHNVTVVKSILDDKTYLN